MDEKNSTILLFYLNEGHMIMIYLSLAENLSKHFFLKQKTVKISNISHACLKIGKLNWKIFQPVGVRPQRQTEQSLFYPAKHS